MPSGCDHGPTMTEPDETTQVHETDDHRPGGAARHGGEPALPRGVLARRAAALADPPTDDSFLDDAALGFDGEQLDREDRAALRRVGGLSTCLLYTSDAADE